MTDYLVPRPIRLAFHSLFTPFSSRSTIVLDEYSGTNHGLLYAAAEVYLGTKIKAHYETSKRKDCSVVDTFDNFQLKWRRYSSGKKRFFELSFDKKFEDRVLNEYLPFVYAKAREIKGQFLFSEDEELDGISGKSLCQNKGGSDEIAKQLFSRNKVRNLIAKQLFSRNKISKRRKKKEEALEAYIEGAISHSGNGNSGWKLTGAREALSINLATFEKPLRKLTFADLLEATNGFHNDTLIGSGGFGDVYRAQLKDGNVVAIKKLIHISGQGDREFTAEMETIGIIKHRNLVRLLGYCKVGEERLLVNEYMKFGSLEDVLHDRKKIGIKLNWAARRKIAIGAARGLAFLHHNCIPHIIHGDMKSSNVLVDENLEARVSDFGMARLMSAMDTHLSVSTLAGTPGYVPPEYYQSFRCSTKGDVYSYGVVLLELLTGKQPTDSPDFGDNNLVGWVKQHAKMKVSDVFDPELMKEDSSLEIELLQHLKVACACLDDRPFRRPTMIQVMAMFKEIQAGSGIDSTSTIATDEGGFCAVEGGVEMSIKEGNELGK